MNRQTENGSFYFRLAYSILYAVWFGLGTILNMTISLSWLYIRIIPMFAIFWFIERISLKQTEEK